MQQPHTLDNAPSQTTTPTPTILVRLTIYVLILAGITFLCAGRLDWWLGWAFLATYWALLSFGTLTTPLDSALQEERTRIKADVKAWDRPLATILSAFSPLGFLVIAGLDLRFGGSPSFPLWLTTIGLIGVALGYLISIWAMRANRFFARFVRIQTERGHTVASEGPYRLVRHPGYLGTLVASVATAVTLGSLWALAASVVIGALVIVRAALEDKTLQVELDGYVAYAARVRYRLIPGLW